MKHLIWITCACLAFIALPASAAQVGIKAGGGVVVDPSRWGGHFSAEIPLGEDYPTYVVPFFEFYSKGGINMIPAGLALQYHAPLSRYGGIIYFGVGGGLLALRGTAPAVTIVDPVLGTFEFPEEDIKVTEVMVTVAGGASLRFTEKVGAFGQLRWFRSIERLDSEGGRNEIGLLIGLRFGLGED